MHRFKNGALVAEICPRHKSQAADQSRAKIGKNIAVQILHEQHVVLIRIHHQLHASVVDNMLAIRDLGIFLRHGTRAAQK